MAAELILTVAHACVLIAFDEQDAELGTPLQDGWIAVQKRTVHGVRIHELVRHKLLDVESGRNLSDDDRLRYTVVYRLSDAGRLALSSGITS